MEMRKVTAIFWKVILDVFFSLPWSENATFFLSGIINIPLFFKETGKFTGLHENQLQDIKSVDFVITNNLVSKKKISRISLSSNSF